MNKIELSQILVKGSKIGPLKLDLDDKSINSFINQINHKQDEILKLKVIDRELLRKEVVGI